MFTHKELLLGKTQDELMGIARELGLKPFVGRQMAEWIYRKGVAEPTEMANLAKNSRELIAASYCGGVNAPVIMQESADGTKKYLFHVHDDHFVETVFIPDGKRATLCVSTQVGCRMGCAFCLTGRQGLEGSLSASGILNQIFAIPERERLTNIVFMGQGEPFDNTDAVLRALEVLTAEWGCGWSPKRITVSTVGVVPGLERFLKESKCHVAVSLHNPLPEERVAMMPAERAWPVRRVIELLRKQSFCRHTEVATGASKQRRLSFEYIVFKGLNDTPRHVDALVSLLKGLDCRVNLIPFHTIPDSPFKSASREELMNFRDALTRRGVFTTVRASRGEDIFAACGLLSTRARNDVFHVGG